ncbi:hypothetical protein BCR42DRAFT_368436 [Absidia repens]|uniref:Uncharacterized protein n=1 Tax=Absidia repens TaxID=90262 RepID=A0A1X2IWB9_9FUNG|nr:hypothetical protein BCR42DRAFT_368436 [Absidia repens]
MISIYKAIKINDVDTISYLINLASSCHTSATSKDTQAWLLPYLKGTNQKHYNLNRRSTLGKTPLHYAILWNRSEIAQKLIDCLLVNINKRDIENGWSPLHSALYLGRMEIVWMLLKRDDLDLNIKDWEGYRALELFDTTINNTIPQLRKLQAPIMDQLRQTCTAEDNTNLSANYPMTFSKSGGMYSSALEMKRQQRYRQGGTDLYTWGMNTNYILGHMDTENRLRPERVTLTLESQHNTNVLQRPSYVIESVHMSKFHMAVLTSDAVHNLLICGFGRGGRLGSGKDTDAQLVPVTVHWSERIAAVALGRDHTIALTSSGSVITFGNNDYGQLGYDTEGRDDGYSMQLYPRKIQAPIMKKQAIIGVAASKVHSVAYTSTEIFTFGYNQGQLGYHHLGNSRRQVTPRKVIYSSNILQVVATDFSTTILFENHDVITLANYETQKMTFLTSRFPTNISVHSPTNNYIIKLVSGSNIYTGAISNMGDVYIWTCKSSSYVADLDMKSEHQRSKQASVFTSTPRRIWTSARAEMVAIDASIGQDGEVIICTASGRVYIGGVTKENAKEDKFKFQYVPQLQRCVYVCANPNGAYAAIRSEYQLPLPPQEPSNLASDLVRSLPCMKISSHLDEQLDQLKKNNEKLLNTLESNSDQLDDTNAIDEKRRLEGNIEQDYRLKMKKLLNTTWMQMEQQDDPTLDVCFWIQGRPIYAHLCILEARRNKEKKGLFPQSLEDDKDTPISKSAGHIEFIITRPHTPTTATTTATRYNVMVKGCHLLSFFVLLEYIYGDTISYFSTRKPSPLCQYTINQHQTDVQDIRYDLISLSSLLGLSHLHGCVNSSYLPTPPPTLATQILSMLVTQNFSEEDRGIDKGFGDVELVLKNGTLLCNEIILRQRCPFFACLFDPNATWMEGRRSQCFSEPAQVNLDHHSMEIMTSLVYYLYQDPEDERDLQLPPFDSPVDDAMHFLLGLLGAADEFLLPGLKVLCERALIPMINLRSVVTLLERSHLYLAPSLKLACLTLILANMSSFVISGLLEHISLNLIRDLEAFVCQKQQDARPYVDRLPTKMTVDTDGDDDSDLQMLFSTWVKEESAIATGFMEYLVTIRPTTIRLSTIPSAENTDVGQLESKLINQEGSSHLKKKSKKKVVPKKDTNGLTTQRPPSSQNDFPSPSSSTTTSWKLGSEPVDESQSKLSLRDLMEKEEAELTAMPSRLPKLSTGTSKKLSQKEKRKLQYQESKTAHVPGSISTKSSISVWGPIPAVNSPGIIIPETPTKFNANENQPLAATSKTGTTIDDKKKEISTKGKKIFANKENLLEEQRYGWKRADSMNIKTTVVFDPRRSFGDTFELIPMTPLPLAQTGSDRSLFSGGGGQGLRRGSSSFHAIQQEQKLEDDWIKGKRKKNLLRIQKEETAMLGLRDFYIQTLGRGSGEWIDIHPSS